MTLDLAPLVQALSEIRSGRLLTVLTGAGTSAEVGLVFGRGEAEDAAGGPAVALPDGHGFRKDPVQSWRLHERRRRASREAQPGPGHLALARIERAVSRLSLLTVNVDGLHQAAGSAHVVELHGSLHRARCVEKGHVSPAPDGNWPELPPLCACGAPLLPDLVFFGEPLPAEAWEAAAGAAAEAAVFLVVGMSSVVSPASTLALLAARAGAKVFEIHAGPAPPSPLADGVYAAGASEVLSVAAAAVGASR